MEIRNFRLQTLITLKSIKILFSPGKGKDVTGGSREYQKGTIRPNYLSKWIYFSNRPHRWTYLVDVGQTLARKVFIGKFDKHG